MKPENYYAMLEDSFRKDWSKYCEGIHELGVEKRINRMDADTINRAAYADDTKWDVKCARAGIGVLGVEYFRNSENCTSTTIQYEFQWRFGPGENERRWAKSVITHEGKGHEGLCGNAACMVVYHAVQEQRKILENKE